MVNKDLLKEIKFIVICSLCIDIILTAMASLFVPFVYALSGALLGTVLLAADLFFLSLTVDSIAREARRGRNGTSKMVFHYILRFLFVGLGLWVAFKIDFSALVCAALPLLYPKVIYPLKAIIKKKEG